MRPPPHMGRPLGPTTPFNLARHTSGLFYVWSILMEVHNPIARAAAKLSQHGHDADAANLESLVNQQAKDMAASEIAQAVKARQLAEDFNGKLLDLVLGTDRPTISAQVALTQTAEMLFGMDAALAAAREMLTTEPPLLVAIRQAIRDYHYALDKRQHGAVAADTALGKISDALGMQWVQGKEAAVRASSATPAAPQFHQSPESVHG